jgi:Arc/MetJ-type ribon-helix-helix transcriptional regulator
MKVSVSLPGDDVRFLDDYAREQGLDSRSAALQRAVRLLRTAELAALYEAAWDEWATTGEDAAWAPATDAGLPS